MLMDDEVYKEEKRKFKSEKDREEYEMKTGHLKVSEDFPNHPLIDY